MTDSLRHANDWIGFSVSVRRVAITLACIITVILTTGTLANWMIYNVAPAPDHPIADVLKRFDLGHEPSIPAFYSASMILCCACVLVAIGRSAKSRQRRWYLLSFCMLAMALDEAVMFHEMVDSAVRIFLPTSGALYFGWVIPAMVLVLAFGIIFLKLLLSLERRTASLFVVSGLLFVAGAVGMEMVAGTIFDAATSEEEALKSISHVISQACEEGLEMVGIAVFFVALIDHVQRNGQGFQFPVVNQHAPRQSSEEGESQLGRPAGHNFRRRAYNLRNRRVS